MGVAARIGRDVAGGGAARARLRFGRRGAGGAARGRGDARSPHLGDEHDPNRTYRAARVARGAPRPQPPRARPSKSPRGPPHPPPPLPHTGASPTYPSPPPP